MSIEQRRAKIIKKKKISKVIKAVRNKHAFEHKRKQDEEGGGKGKAPKEKK